MDIFSVIEENAANELVQRAAELPVQPTIMDIANLLGVSRSTAYKLAHSEGFPSIQLQGFRRLLISKKLFLDWFVKLLQENGTDFNFTAKEGIQDIGSKNDRYCESRKRVIE